MIFAIVDIGSHTLRLAVYEEEKGECNLLTKKKFALGLAGYLKNNVMAEEGVLALLSVLRQFRAFLDAFKIENISAFATAAFRMAENRDDIVARIRKETGFSVRILSGKEEAELAFIGVTRTSPVKTGVLVDIGGGSTEIVSFSNGIILMEKSLPIGAVSLSKKYDAEFFPASSVLEAISRETIDALSNANINVTAKFALTLGGAAKGARILLSALEGNKLKETINLPMTVGDIRSLLRRFDKNLTDADKVLLLKEVADRVPILMTGFSMLAAILSSFGVEEVYYREGGVREGFISEVLLNA
ncbi:MAG: hypothetical protein IKN12_02420 [Selenomonadaceae bacterium]|nr:hypothetical protein [Selenomonadaceae bacterium]